jgi:hypothetical protein
MQDSERPTASNPGMRQGLGALIVCAAALAGGCGPWTAAAPAASAAAKAPLGATTAPAPIRSDALLDATYPSKMLSAGTATLTGGRYSDPLQGIIITLLPAPMAHGVIAGQAVTAVLIAESGGGSGTFISVILMSEVNGELQSIGSAFLGDRPRVKDLRLDDQGNVTVDMLQVGAHDKFCCPATPMTVEYAYRQGELVGQTLTSTSINPAGYAGQANGFIVEGTAYDTSVPPGGQGEPRHFAWTFGTDTDLEAARAHAAGTGYVALYPVAAYRAIWEAANDPFVADTLAALERLLAARPADPVPPLPVLPQVNAVNDLAARVAYLDLPDGGRGVRFIGRFAQDAVPLRNSQLRYVFQGLSADGSRLLVASLPITAATLPEENEIAEVAGTTPGAGIGPHLECWTAAFATESFEPALETLDKLLQSVTVTVADLTAPNGH